MRLLNASRYRRQALLALDGNGTIAAETELFEDSLMSDLHPSFERATGDAVAHFQPLITVIAAIANGDETRRAEVEYLLPQIDNNGWHIEQAIQRIWQGERDAAALTTSLDANSAAIVLTVLAAVAAAPADAEET